MTWNSPFGRRSSNQWRNWSSGEEAKLRAEVAADQRLDTIAVEHRRTLAAIKMRIKKLGLPLSTDQKRQMFGDRHHEQ